MPSQTTTVSAHIAHALAIRVTDVFGVMGNGNAHLLDALEHTAVRYTAVRHEAGGVAAADAYFRTGGRIAAATTTYGAGYTNTITALTESAQARIPLVLVIGDQPTAGPRPWDVDQVAIAEAIGVPTIVIGSGDAAAKTLEAVDVALTTARPVVLAIPYDLADAEAGPFPMLCDVTPSKRSTLDATPKDTLSDVAAEIIAARRPLLLAGRGAWLADASEQLGRLAHATGAVTASTALGRGIFPDDHYDLGVTGGFGQKDAMELIENADLAVVFGASLSQFTMRFGKLFSPETRVIQVDVTERATHPRVDKFIRGDARDTAKILADELAAIDAKPSGWRESIDFAPLRVLHHGDGHAPDGRLDPRSVAARLAELLPDDRVVVSDGGHFIGWANSYWPVASPDRMAMVGTAYQTIGLGIPSVVGAAQAKPSSTIVLTTGDGGGLMAVSDLESAIRVAGGRGLAVVWNDGAYGAELNLYGLKGLAEGPMLIPQVDFAAVATAFGAEGVVVEDLEALNRLSVWSDEPADSRGFLLLDCRISPHVIAPYQHEVIEVNQGRQLPVGG